jgi:nucleoside-diphosphate-sugar epimerase
MRIQYPKGIKYCIVRPANVYGIESLNRDNLMVISDLIKKAKLNGNIELMTDGEEIRDFIHARDVARAMVLTMRNMPDKPIAVGSGKGVKIKTIARLIANKTNSNLKLGKKKADCQKRVMNVKDLKKLGFKQTVKIREGIEEVIKCNR